jgi:alpha,alpha-trehalase
MNTAPAESYREDYDLSESLGGNNQDSKDKMNIEMKSGAESGWDYSSRWMMIGKVGSMQMHHCSQKCSFPSKGPSLIQ